MKDSLHPISARFSALALSGMLMALCAGTQAVRADEVLEAIEQAGKNLAKPRHVPATDEEAAEQASDDQAVKSRIFLTNGDKLSGLPHGMDDEGNLEFTSDSLRQKAGFPVENILSLQLDTWKHRPRPETVARVRLQPSFSETRGDTLFGSLHELTPESVKLETWYGGIISLKRSMVQSLQIISNGPGSYYGPNSIKEWTFADDNKAWEFESGSLKSTSDGAIGRDIGLTEKAHISFDTRWNTSMRFRLHLYSSDVSEGRPDAYYDLNFNRSYAYLRTRGKANGGGVVARGGRWKQLNLPRDKTDAHFDIYIDRKSGTITVYIDNVHVCVLQSQAPDPENLGTGMSFVGEKRYPIEISNIAVVPWNGTSLPNQQLDLQPAGQDKEQDADEKDALPPHRIILKNGDEVPGTVGKVQDGRMIIETKYTPIRIPLKRIKSLSLGDTGAQPRKYAGDVRAWFHEGGHVTLRLASFQDGKISGYSQAFGEVSLDLNAFSRIDFHIYDKEQNKLRQAAR